LINTDIIDLQNNPFSLKSWIDQGYPFTLHRQEQFIDLIGEDFESIQYHHARNEGSYVAFVAVRWGFAALNDGKLTETEKWLNHDMYDNYGNPIATNLA
jgi:hypothetical protein